MCSSEKLGSHHGQFDNMPLVSNSLNDDKQQISAGTGLNRNPQPVTLVALQSTWPHGAAIETIFKDLSYGGSQKSRLDNRMVSRTPSWTSNSTSNWRQIGLWPSLKHHLIRNRKNDNNFRSSYMTGSASLDFFFLFKLFSKL